LIGEAIDSAKAGSACAFRVDNTTLPVAEELDPPHVSTPPFLTAVASRVDVLHFNAFLRAA